MTAPPESTTAVRFDSARFGRNTAVTTNKSIVMAPTTSTAAGFTTSSTRAITYNSPGGSRLAPEGREFVHPFKRIVSVSLTSNSNSASACRFEIPLHSGEWGVWRLYVIGREDATNTYGSWQGVGDVFNPTAGPSGVNSTINTISGVPAGWGGPIVSINGPNLRVAMQGAVGTTIRWRVVFELYNVDFTA